MLTANILLNIVSIIIFILIIVIIFINCIYTYNSNNYVETYSNFEEPEEIVNYGETSSELSISERLKKCPRGCGHHKSVPDCNECNAQKKDYDISTPAERLWIDKYHIIGNQMETYAKDKMLEWKNIDGNIKFRYVFLKNNELHYVSIHPDYFNILYSIYNPEKNSSNNKIVSEWMKKLEIDELEYANLKKIQHTNNWKYIDLEPKQWVKETIREFVLKNKLFSEQFRKELSYEDKVKYNIIDTDSILTEYLANIGKPLSKSYDIALKRWELFEDSSGTVVNNELYALKIIENISTGHGLHIDDIILLFRFNKQTAKNYLETLIEKLETAEQNRKEFIETYKTRKGCVNDCFVFKLKTDCAYNDDKTLFSEINVPIKIKNTSNILIYNFWPIFKNDIYTVNEKQLIGTSDTYCAKETKCYNSNFTNKEHCLFLSPMSIPNPLMSVISSAHINYKSESDSDL
jgi:hypothetical protein